MIFQDFSVTEKKIILAFLSALLCWWLFFCPATCSASGTYTITEAELTILENNLARLSAINSQLQAESKTQKEQSAKLLEQVSLLQNQLTTLREQSLKQEALLTAANKSLEAFATEAKRERLRIKAQRNGWLVATIVTAAIAIAK